MLKIAWILQNQFGCRVPKLSATDAEKQHVRLRRCVTWLVKEITWLARLGKEFGPVREIGSILPAYLVLDKKKKFWAKRLSLTLHKKNLARSKRNSNRRLGPQQRVVSQHCTCPQRRRHVDTMESIDLYFFFLSKTDYETQFCYIIYNKMLRYSKIDPIFLWKFYMNDFHNFWINWLGTSSISKPFLIKRITHIIFGSIDWELPPLPTRHSSHSSCVLSFS